MSIRVIDSKKIEMTNDEWTIYEKIVKSYTTLTNRGEDLFSDLFHTNDQGIILFLIPPSKKQTSMEVWLFLTSLMVNQHLRLAHAQIDDMANQFKNKMQEFDAKIEKLLSKK